MVARVKPHKTSKLLELYDIIYRREIYELEKSYDRPSYGVELLSFNEIKFKKLRKTSINKLIFKVH